MRGRGGEAADPGKPLRRAILDRKPGGKKLGLKLVSGREANRRNSGRVLRRLHREPPYSFAEKLRATLLTAGPETVKSMKRASGRTTVRGSRRGSRSSMPKGLDELSREADEAIARSKVEITDQLETQAKNGVPGSMKLLVDLAKLRMGAETAENSEQPGVSRAEMWSKELKELEEENRRAAADAGAGISTGEEPAS